MISGKEDAANNFARGHYNNGKEIVDLCLDRIRKLVDKCIRLEGFLVVNAAGRAGNGLGSLLLDRLSVDYEKKKIKTLILCLSITLSINSCIKPYNSVLSTHSLLDILNTQLQKKKTKEKLMKKQEKLMKLNSRPILYLIQEFTS